MKANISTEKFVNSIYLGDRACKQLNIDTWSKTVSIQVDTISRIRSDDGNWNFYCEEDINDGFLVFKEVESILFNGNGKLPNDRINYLNAVQQIDGLFSFTLSIDSIDKNGVNEEIILKLIAKEICIQDPSKPDKLIVT